MSEAKHPHPTSGVHFLVHLALYVLLGFAFAGVCRGVDARLDRLEEPHGYQCDLGWGGFAWNWGKATECKEATS